MLTRLIRSRSMCCRSMFLILAVAVSAGAPAQDNYLDMLDAYAEDAGDEQSAAAAGGGQAGGNRGAFESQLRRNFKGSYVLYAKLSEPNKEKVFAKYQETGKVSDVRSLIVRLYANR